MTIDVYDEQGKEIRAHGTAAFPVAHYSGDWKAASVQLHWHRELEAGFVTAGQITLYVNKEVITLRKGDGFFINSGIPHAFLEAQDAESCQCSLVFDPVLVGGRFSSVFWQQYVQPVLGAAAMSGMIFRQEQAWQREAVGAVETAWSHCNEPRPGYEIEVRHSLSRLMALLAEHLPAEDPAQSRHIARDNERIRTMMGYIQSHFMEELTVAQIAESAMISPSECLRCFHNTIGLTPIQYTKYYRIQRAAAALLATDKKIAEIGAECGFQEMSYFAKVFREVLKTTPSEYRRRHRSGG